MGSSVASKNGWLEPVFYGPGENGPVGAFSPEDYAKIQAGYACPRCWQEFAMILPKCPVCGADLRHNLDPHIVEYPEDWVPGDREKKPLQ